LHYVDNQNTKFLGEPVVVSEEEIKKCFSEELSWIKEVAIREKVVAIWKTAADERGWNSIHDVPFTLLFDNSGKLTDHTKRITRMVYTIMKQRNEGLNQDYLIAGALLHDVGKLVEYDIVDQKIVKGEYGKKFRHPVSGAKLAWQHGLPDEIAHIIYAHSHEGDKTKRSAEAVIVNHCDFIDFEIKKSMVEE
jgi:putative nucleotidyltransferase with HDIG domain